MKKLINLHKESIPLELATNDVGKGYMHCTIPGKGELVVEDDQITLVIEKLSKKNRHRKAAIAIEEIEIKLVEPEEVDEPVVEDDIEEEEEEEIEVDNVTDYRCEECDRVFGTERGLRTHMRVHAEIEVNEDDTEED